MKLSNKDYIKIVKYYGKSIPLTKKRKVDHVKTRKLAKHILANKLCMCIKKVQKTNKKLKEPAALAICNNSIFKKRNVKQYRFTCKKGPKLLNKKGTNISLSKTSKNIKFYNKKKKSTKK